MTKPLKIASFLLLMALTFASASLVQAQETSTDLKLKMRQLMMNWKTASVENLDSPENAEVRSALRTAYKEGQVVAATILVRSNDDETINERLAAFRSEDPLVHASGMHALVYSGNPKMVTMLAKDLFKKESTKAKLVDGCLELYPVSLSATKAIRAIVAQSPYFPPVAREWATNFDGLYDALRASTRAWWKLNQAAIEQGNYQAATAVPPRS